MNAMTDISRLLAQAEARAEWRRAWGLTRLIGYRLVQWPCEAKVAIAERYGIRPLMLLRAAEARAFMACGDPLRRSVAVRSAMRWGPLGRMRRAA